MDRKLALLFCMLAPLGTAFAQDCADFNGTFKYKEETQIIKSDCATLVADSSDGYQSTLVLDGEQHKGEGPPNLVPHQFYKAHWEGQQLVTEVTFYKDDSKKDVLKIQYGRRTLNENGDVDVHEVHMDAVTGAKTEEDWVWVRTQ